MGSFLSLFFNGPGIFNQPEDSSSNLQPIDKSINNSGDMNTGTQNSFQNRANDRKDSKNPQQTIPFEEITDEEKEIVTNIYRLSRQLFDKIKPYSKKPGLGNSIKKYLKKLIDNILDIKDVYEIDLNDVDLPITTIKNIFNQLEHHHKMLLKINRKSFRLIKRHSINLDSAIKEFKSTNPNFLQGGKMTKRKMTKRKMTKRKMTKRKMTKRKKSKRKI
jgi:DNA-binding protein Fis